jgi:hypothetical protein
MACASLTDYTIGCRDGGPGGLSCVWIIDLDNIESIAESSGLVTGITKATGERFYKIEIPQSTAEGKDSVEASTENGAVVYNHEVTIPLNKRDATVRNMVKTLAKARTVIVTKEMNGNYMMYGWDNGLWLNSGEGTSGVAGTDRNGYNLTFSGQQREPALQVNAAMAAALETPGT